MVFTFTASSFFKPSSAGSYSKVRSSKAKSSVGPVELVAEVIDELQEAADALEAFGGDGHPTLSRSVEV